VFEWQVLNQTDTTKMPERARLMAKRRSSATPTIFAGAMLVALSESRIGFGLICCALVPYLTPKAPGARLEGRRARHPDTQIQTIIHNPTDSY
jgi:hypothetical protein